MHDYLFGVEAVRFAFMFGIVVSLILYERWHLTTGSIVVPGYIGVFILHPLVIAATFANAFASFFLVNRVLPRYVLLYGRTKFSVLVMISIVIQTLMLRLSPSSPWLWESDMPLIVGAGYVVPALIAHDMGRQGRVKTLRAVTVSGLLVAAPLLMALLFLPAVQAERILVNFEVLAISPRWVPVAVLLSAVAAWGVLHNHKARCGGFMGAAYLAMLAKDGWQVGFLAVSALVTYFVVTRVLGRMTILFGRRKFAAMLLTSSLVSWSTLWLGAEVLGLTNAAYTTLASVVLVPLFVPGLLANDMERVGIPRATLGTAVAATFVFATTTWLSSIGNPIATPTTTWVMAAVALVAGSLIFDAQIAGTVRYLTARVTGRRRAAAPTPAEAGLPQEPMDTVGVTEPDEPSETVEVAAQAPEDAVEVAAQAPEETVEVAAHEPSETVEVAAQAPSETVEVAAPEGEAAVVASMAAGPDPASDGADGFDHDEFLLEWRRLDEQLDRNDKGEAQVRVLDATGPDEELGDGLPDDDAVDLAIGAIQTGFGMVEVDADARLGAARPDDGEEPDVVDDYWFEFADIGLFDGGSDSPARHGDDEWFEFADIGLFDEDTPARLRAAKAVGSGSG